MTNWLENPQVVQNPADFVAQRIHEYIAKLLPAE